MVFCHFEGNSRNLSLPPDWDGSGRDTEKKLTNEYMYLENE